MALRLYLSPTEQVGGYTGIPRTTKIFDSPWGPPTYNGLVDPGGSVFIQPTYRLVQNSGNTLPIFPLTTTQPGATPATIINQEIPVHITQPTLFGVPVALGACVFTADTTVNPIDFLPLPSDFGRWATEYWLDNYSAAPNFPQTYYSQIIPSCAYVWRPSTNTMVGMLWSCYSQNYLTTNGGTWGVYAAAWKDTAQPPYNYKWPSNNYLYQFGGAEFSRVGLLSLRVEQVIDAYTQSVNALTGDALVVEYHLYWAIDPYGAPNAGTLKFSMSIGGGTDATPATGQPMAPPGNVYYTEATPVHNTFIDLPTLSSITFPTTAPSLADNKPFAQFATLDATGAEYLAGDVAFDKVDTIGFAQLAEFSPPKPPPLARYDLNIYGLSLDKVTGVQFMPYGPQFALGQNVVIDYINDEPNIDGTQPFIIPYQAGEGVSTQFDVNGQNFDFVYGMQFVPYGPTSGDPSPTPTGPAEPPIPLAEGDYYYLSQSQIGIYSWNMLNYLDNGTFQRDTWYKLLLHCNEQQVQVDPTLSPTGPPVPAIPLVPPDFALITNEHIGIPYNIQQWLLASGILQYQLWYKFYLTYECGVIPPIIPEARAIHPNQGWNWDPAYVVAPNIIYSQVIDELNGSLSNWVMPTFGSATATQSNIGITLAAGPEAGSIASLNSLLTYPQGDWTIDFNINRPTSGDILPSTFTYLSVEYRLPADGYVVVVSRQYSPDIGHAYTASIMSSGEPVGGSVATNAWRGSLRIIRYKNSITLLAKDIDQTRWQTIAYTRTAPVGGTGYIAISTTNNDVTQIASVLVERYTLNPGVMFGTEPAVYAEIGNSNINLLVQPQLIDTTRFVTIATYTPTTILKETIRGFEYVRPNQFNLGGQPAGDWWIYRAVPTQPATEQANEPQDVGTRLLSLVLSPMSGQYRTGQAVQYRAIARFNDGSRQDVTTQCEWTTTDPEAFLTQRGLIYYGTLPGVWYVTATYIGMSQTAIGRTSSVARFASISTLTTDPSSYAIARYSGIAQLIGNKFAGISKLEVASAARLASAAILVNMNMRRFACDVTLDSVPLPLMVQTSYPSARSPGPPTYPIQIPNFITPDLTPTTFGGTYGMYVGISFDAQYAGVIPVITLDGGAPLPGRHSTDPLIEPCYITDSIVTGTAWSFVVIWLGNHIVGEADPIDIAISYNSDVYHVAWRQIPLVQSGDVTAYTYDGTWMTGGVVSLTGRNLLGTTITAPSPYIDVSTPSAWVIPSSATNTVLQQSRSSVAQLPPVQLYSFAARYNHEIGNTGIKVYSEAYQWSPAIMPIPVPPYGTSTVTARMSQMSQLSEGVFASPSMVETVYPASRCAPGSFMTWTFDNWSGTAISSTPGMFVALTFATAYAGITPSVSLDGGAALPYRNTYEYPTVPCVFTNTISSRPDLAKSFFIMWLGNPTYGTVDPIHITIRYSSTTYVLQWHELPLSLACTTVPPAVGASTVELSGRNLDGATIGTPVVEVYDTHWNQFQHAYNTTSYYPSIVANQFISSTCWTTAINAVNSYGVAYNRHYPPAPSINVLSTLYAFKLSSPIYPSFTPVQPFDHIGISRMSQTASLLKVSVRGIVPSIVVPAWGAY